MKHATIEDETESLRQLVIAARKSPEVADEAKAAFDRLAAAYAKDPKQFTEEDVRFLNVLRGTLGGHRHSTKIWPARTFSFSSSS